MRSLFIFFLSYTLYASNSGFDQTKDYSRFSGRVSDRNQSHTHLKISSESKNMKFFRTGDQIYFRLSNRDTEYCSGYVRNVEEGYIVITHNSLKPCLGKQNFILRGTSLLLFSERLNERVRDADLYHRVLSRKKKNFRNQYNEVNHFIYSFHQQRLKLASEFDRKIHNLKEKKDIALQRIIDKKRESAILQKELNRKILELEKNLQFYTIDSQSLLKN